LIQKYEKSLGLGLGLDNSLICITVLHRYRKTLGALDINRQWRRASTGSGIC